MVLMACFMLGEKFTTLRLASLALGLCGTLLISVTDLEHVSFDQRVLLGNVIVFFAGAGSAFYNTYSKDLLSRYSEAEVLLYSYLVAALACAVVSLAVDRPSFVQVWEADASTWLAIAVLGLLSWGLAMVLWMWVLNRLEVGQISTSIYLLPVFGVILSVITVHDRFTGSQILGAVLALVGTATLTVFERNIPAETTQATSK
jgi:drug/metabolite transporter (DMT)-like permease